MKKIIATIGVLLLCSFGIYASQKEYKPLSAEDDSSEVLDSSEPEESSEPENSEEQQEEPVVEEEQPVEEAQEENKTAKEEIEQEIVNKLTVFKDTYLVPLISGLSVTNLISCAVAIILAIRNRKTNSDIHDTNNKTQDNALLVINAAVALKDTADKLILEVQNDKQISAETKQEIIEQANFIKNSYDGFTKTAEKMFEIKTCVIMLIQIQAKLVEMNPQAVSNGVANQIAELNEQAKKLL